MSISFALVLVSAAVVVVVVSFATSIILGCWLD